MLYVATRSIAQGKKAGIASAFGIHTGILTHTIVAAIGLSAIVAASAITFSIIKYAGAIYLLYLAIRTITDRTEFVDGEIPDKTTLKEIFWQGVITNILNPKVVLFFLAFVPQFVDPEIGNIGLQVFMLGLILIITTLPIDIAIGLAGGKVGRWLHRRSNMQKIGKWVTASIFTALGIGTALTKVNN